ncbi:hypothetical protein O181_122820 [Austropuccinia psidii MF-1]|uniref:Uncharacterized protein n=1 Tax=Austropuccinia psidii MF-1 TaxID=1389203 RepID=A0A9Q3KQ03_9BASI|nr:hypothetical protein [Austropuccinia psidii MF-1]
MIKIQEPRRTWKSAHMDWVTGLPPGSDKSYNACLVIVDGFSKTPIFLPSHKDDTAMDLALLIWNRVVSWCHRGSYGSKGGLALRNKNSLGGLQKIKENKKNKIKDKYSKRIKEKEANGQDNEKAKSQRANQMNPQFTFSTCQKEQWN